MNSENKSFLFREVDESSLPWFVRGPAAPLFIALGPSLPMAIGLFSLLVHYFRPDKKSVPELIVIGIVLLMLIPIAWPGDEKGGFVNNVKMTGCAIVAALGITLALTIVFSITYIVGHWTDYKIAQTLATSAVDIARLQAQDHITVACMKYSWFTTMTQCISAGGVNGTGWGLWQWLMLTGGLVVGLKGVISWLGSEE